MVPDGAAFLRTSFASRIAAARDGPSKHRLLRGARGLWVIWHVFSVTQDSKGRAAVFGVRVIACAMFSGVAPRLSELKKLGLAVKPLIWGLRAAGSSSRCMRPKY